MEYPPTGEIMAELRGLEKKIGEKMDELERLLGGVDPICTLAGLESAKFVRFFESMVQDVNKYG